MLALCAAVWGAICENYGSDLCGERNDGGCLCEWDESRGSCTKTDVCDGIGPTSVVECTAPDGSVVGEGTSFPAADGCNTCVCGEMIMCTEMACNLCPDGCVPTRRARHLLFASVPDGSWCGQGCEPA